MSKMLADGVNWLLSRYGLEIRRKYLREVVEADQRHMQIMEDVRPYTLTSRERIWALMNSIDYVVNRGIEGAIVECGVWRGGSMMTVSKRLQHHSDIRDLYLFDTFEGMSEPSEFDTATGHDVRKEWEQHQTSQQNEWCYAPLDEVRKNVLSTGYPEARIRFIKGKVEDTLQQPINLPEKIAVLRLDTDWYESTKSELEILYPRLAIGGVLIIDDYGYWDGARRAVTEYFATPSRGLLLNYIDNTGRIAVKV